MTEQRQLRPANFKNILILLLIFGASLPIKFAAAQNMPFDIDYVPVISRNLEYPLPPVGTLSSVAAYNMPMLQWLMLPALHLTGNVWWTIILTLLLWNLLGTLAVFKLTEAMFGRLSGYLAAALFTFSEVGVSSFFTAWAQLLLPTFFAVTLWALWSWRTKEKGYYLALAGIFATGAFMAHFSAILLFPAMLVFAVVSRAKWQWGWLGLGALACLLMLSPYLLFEAARDFVDLKAFLSQEILVAPEVLDQYKIYQSGYRPPSNTATPSSENQSNQPDNPSSRPAAKTLWERVLDYVLELPSLLFRAVQYAFFTGTRGLAAINPQLAFLGQVLFALPMLLFWLGLPMALLQFWRQRSWDAITNTEAGRYLLLWLFLAVILIFMVFTRTLKDVTYLTGLTALQTVMLGYSLKALTLNPSPTRRGTSNVLYSSRMPYAILALLVLLFCLFQVGERAARLFQHEDSQFTAYNISLYRHIEAATDAIAADWQGGETLVVSYDILPESPNLWWTPAWYSIDPSYRMGMSFDLLLSLHHGLHNENLDPIGKVDNADYIVIYAPAATRYDLAQLEVWEFGVIWVLKPVE